MSRATGRTPAGLVGVGLLGGAIAERLLGAGFRVVVADVDPSRSEALRRLGGEAVGDPSEVFRACDRVLLSLPTSDVVAAVIDRAEGALRPGQVVIDTTTGAPRDAEAAGARLAARGVAYLDATVSGSSAQARAGDAVIMAGGDPETFAACRDLFAALARSAFHVGPVGSGSRMKLATNLVLGLNRAALAEGLAFARAIGLDPALTLDVLRAGAAYSRVMDAKGPKMVSGDFTPQARLAQHLKDVRLILDEAARAGAVTPLSCVHRGLLESAEAAGFGEADNSAVLRAFDPPGPGPS
jgi:3-hydroxyisobutyrate dehydrogenase-like beta-hydroxyacid dehydrogenase